MRRLFAICVFMFAPAGAWAADSADQQARALFALDRQWRLQHQPEFATAIGDYRYDATLSDTSLAASRAANAHERKMIEQAHLIEHARLTGQNRLSYDLFVEQKERRLKAAGFYPYDPQPLTAQRGIHLNFPRLVAMMPFATEADYRNYLARIDALPAHIDGLIEQMRESMRSGWTSPKVTVRAVPDMLKQLRENLVDGTPGLPFREIPAAIAKQVRDDLALAGPAALRARAAPALLRLEEFVRADYLPAARETIAASSLPGGADYYQFMLSDSAGPGVGAAAVHALGLKEVARIRAEMRAAIARTGFRGSFERFSVFANSDPRLIAAPGQAVGYKLGQLKIAALRDKERATLGARFDLRRFHGAVLDDGPLPLAMLERQVEHWIEATARDPSPPLEPPSAQ